MADNKAGTDKTKKAIGGSDGGRPTAGSAILLDYRRV